MPSTWSAIALRMVRGLGVRPGELIEVRDESARPDVLMEILGAVESVGAIPLPRIASPDYLEALVSRTSVEDLGNWDHDRRDWLAKVDRKLLLGSYRPGFPSAPPEALAAWNRAVQRLAALEDARRIPLLVAGIPTARRAAQAGLSLEALERVMMPALAASPEELQAEIARVLRTVKGCRDIVIRSGERHELRLKHGNRPWLSDDGCIDDADRERGAIVSNLPGGSVYTTILESETEGSLSLPSAGPARDVVIRFSRGRIVSIDATSGAGALNALFNGHRGEPRRIGHVGIGLNPYLRQPVGWTLVDEHIHGNLFVSFGDNRYMGGENESSLNIDFCVPNATLAADGRAIAIGA